jgi:hypothetical protein
VNRTAELSAIDQHIETHGLYLCAPGESLYGDEAIPFRETQRNIARNFAAQRRKPRPECAMDGCHNRVKAAKHKYCSPECFAAGRTHPLIAVNCDECGAELKRKEWLIKQNRHNFCNRACHVAHLCKAGSGEGAG